MKSTKGSKRAVKRSGSSEEQATGLPTSISHPDKVFWSDEGYTKLDLARFYMEIFPHLSPYVKDHILTLERCPDGMEGECFYQKELPKGMPSGTPSKRVAHVSGDKSTNYVVGGLLETQLALVNLGCIAVHVTASRASAPRKPDWICFDLDPESGEFADAARAALQVKEALDVLEMVSFVKTSGSRGIHIMVPIHPGPDVDEVLAFAQEFVGRVAAAHPDKLTVEHSIAARRNHVYLDPFRNGFMQTVVAPYSVRRRPKAPISTPLHWSEVKPSLDPADFNLANFAQRLKQKDPWHDFFSSRQSLKSATQLLEKI